MADRWWGALEIPNAPAEWTKAIEHTSPHTGEKWVAHELDPDGMPEALYDALNYLGIFEEIERDEDGELRIQDAELAGGSYAFGEQGVFNALKALGLAFRAYDDGDYGNPGIYYFWRPGLDEIQERTYAAETGVVIDVTQLALIFELTNFAPAEHPELAQTLRDYFDLTPDATLLPERVENPTT